MIRAYDPINKRWYTWSMFIPDNLLDLIKQEGFILEKDMKDYDDNILVWTRARESYPTLQAGYRHGLLCEACTGKVAGRRI